MVHVATPQAAWIICWCCRADTGRQSMASWQWGRGLRGRSYCSKASKPRSPDTCALTAHLEASASPVLRQPLA